MKNKEKGKEFKKGSDAGSLWVYKKRFAAFLTAAVLLTFFLRAPFYLKKQVYNVDEGTLAAVANTILDGGLPYRDSWDTRGPVTFYIYAAVFSFFGRNNMLAVHFLLIIFLSFSCFFLMLIGRRLGEPLAGDMAGLLYAVVSFTYLKMDMLAANIEMFMVLFILIGVYLFIGGMQSRSRPFFFFGGFFLGLAFLTKQPALTDWAGLLLFLLFFTGTPHFRLRNRLIAAAAMGAGFLLPPATIIAVYIYKGAFRDFVFGFWTYSSRYFLPAMAYEDRLRMAFAGPLPIIRDNMYAWGSAIIYAALLLFGFARRKSLSTKEVLLFWSATSFVAASGSGRAFGHYYIQLLPPVVLLSSIFTVSFLPALIEKVFRPFERWSRRFRTGTTFIGPVKVKNLTVTLIVLAGYGLPLSKYYHPRVLRVLADAPLIAAETVDERSERGLGRNLKELVRHIRNNSSGGDSIFVWGFYPQVYLLANRRPATRFSYCIYLTGLVPWVNVHPRKDTSRYIVPESWDLLMKDLVTEKPLFIIDTAPGNVYFWKKYPIKKFPRLNSYIDEYYKLDKIIKDRKGKDRFHIYRVFDG